MKLLIPPYNYSFSSFKIFDSDELIRDFKPCVNPDGTIGVYDFVSDSFFKLNGIENYKVVEESPTECNCWHCVAERITNSRRVSKMQIGKVYLYQLYSECFEEFDTLEDAEWFRNYADENIPYWDYDPVTTINLNDPEQIIIYKHRGWIKDSENVHVKIEF